MDETPIKTIFIFAYYSYKDPVFQSAVLPYFIGLSEGTNFRFVLITFEQQKYKLQSGEAEEIKAELLKHNIIWVKAYWHSGKFKILKKTFDFLWGILLSGYLVIRYKVSSIYSEGFPGAIIGHNLAKIFSLPHLVHTYEPHTDYMVEAGVWSADSWEARLLKIYEEKVAKGAKCIFTATEGMIKRLEGLNINAQIYRVPSCVDMSVFKFSQEGRDAVRKKYEIQKTDCVITYLGKFGGMYMDEEVFDFFKICEYSTELNYRYLIITPDHTEIILKYISIKELDLSKFIIVTLSRTEIGDYLSASDFGLVSVRQRPSKQFCSPIKNGEYWACGLPILIPKGISDDYLFAQEHNIGIVFEDMSSKSMEEVSEKIVEWQMKNNKEEVTKRCRDCSSA